MQNRRPEMRSIPKRPNCNRRNGGVPALHSATHKALEKWQLHVLVSKSGNGPFCELLMRPQCIEKHQFFPAKCAGHSSDSVGFKISHAKGNGKNGRGWFAFDALHNLKHVSLLRFSREFEESFRRWWCTWFETDWICRDWKVRFVFVLKSRLDRICEIKSLIINCVDGDGNNVWRNEKGLFVNVFLFLHVKNKCLECKICIWIV